MSEPPHHDLPNSSAPHSSSSTPPSASSSCSSRESAKLINGGGTRSSARYPNPPDPFNPDAATLRDQWRFAIRQYSRWYSQAWGTAILAGLSFFALGWVIKGSNPLPSRKDPKTHEGPQ